MPRPFPPLSSVNVKPSDKDTASLLSTYTFTFLDPIVYHANRVGNVIPDDMPGFSVSEKIEILSKRAFKSLDPAQCGKRNVLWGASRVLDLCRDLK
jgi:hypothetical protein